MAKKIETLNLELGQPTVEVAVQRMKNTLSTYKRQGSKGVVVIHGWGSSGVGGSIKAAVKKALLDSDMRGLVRASAGGEEWSQKKRELIGMCRALEEERNIEGNAGVTVVVLR